MTMRFNNQVNCGHCNKTSEHSILGSTNAFGSPDLDLRPPEMQRSTMDTWLQLCPWCGYCASDLSEAPEDPSILESEAYQAALHSTTYPELARRFMAYAVAESTSDPVSAAQSYLRAAWACDDDEEELQQAADCRRRSAEWFKRCQPFSEDEAGASMGAVYIDVLRRCSQFDEATTECNAVLASPTATGLIRTVLEYQLQLIRRADIGTHELSECDEQT